MKKYLIILTLVFGFINFVAAQITNTGIIYVKPNAVLSFADNFNNVSSGSFWNNGNVYAFNNWHNDGVVDFSVLNIDSGFTGFVGTESQIISGDSFSNFYNTLFDNDSPSLAFQLEGNISVTNESDFNSGIIDNKFLNGMFVFEQNADHIGASDESHVNGDVIKIGDNAFDFPIGNNIFYRNASISAPSAINETFTAEYFFENTNSTYPVNSLGDNLMLIDNAEHWVIDRSSGQSLVYITLTWSNDTTPNEILNAPIESIHIARWDDALQTWVDQGGLQDASSESVSALVDNYGVFTLALIKEENAVMDFPLFLTPNDDTYNDTWNINPSEDREIITIYIFDRFGKLLKQLDPNGSGWDGTYNGNKMKGSDYWFVAEYKDLTDNTMKQFKSHFALKY